MTSIVTSFRFQRTALALAVCAAFAPVQAQAEDDAASAAQTTISVGLGAVDGSNADRALFRQYNGLRDQSAVGMLDIDYSLRKPETSSWVQFTGSNLLGDTRELGLVWKNPGSWKFTADYGELVHYDPNTVNTGLLGAGSTTPQVVVVPQGTGAELDLKTKRTSLGLGFTKIISPRLQFAVDLKTENKEGARLFGLGQICSPLITGSCNTALGSGVLMLPEPINANHSQVEARLSYALEKLRFSVGYYGSFYRNDNAALQPNLGGFASTTPVLNSLALAPDNQAHQLDLSGSYDFTSTTHGSFKLGYAQATQNADFAGAGLVGPAGVANLGAQVNTTMAKIGITSRPIPKLSLLADLRYEDKDDQTPLANYNVAGAGATAVSATNRDLSSKKIKGKLQASWQFTSDYRGTLGADYESIDRGAFTATSAVSGFIPLRQETTETGVRAELRRRLTNDLSGAISISSSKRDGSNWLQGSSSATGVTEVADPATSLSSAIFMPTLADRQRDKIKLFADWQPSEKLSLQFSAEEGKDKFSTPSTYGLHDTRMNQFSVDWGYALSDKWALNGYVSQGLQTLNQSHPAGYVIAFDNTNTGVGLGFTGKLASKLLVGGNLSYVDDKSVYKQTLVSSGGLPDVVYRQTALKLFGKYELEKGSSVRVDLVHQRVSVNDWAWDNNGAQFAYSDGTTVTQNPNQTVSFIGVTYIYLLK
ncbi:MtrB/PioB family decaheme-associated outer membrane protein [Rhodoferax ferrireducens]|uniref:MtrB/PioB family decaheme-associated outer membrane protein n=1 Tax=Rhodoferax ferrireducens TaxID=192843 RepID=UPI00298D8A1D|nr:MtrB/PioB family decaheme-associated outer membrane protein [Rhodoferax ferrireducens]WPC66819.1 MtrB/PioB family decaheme-associated outer membrane protein [Rhodoferax ferrireducens]